MPSAVMINKRTEIWNRLTGISGTKKDTVLESVQSRYLAELRKDAVFARKDVRTVFMI